MPAEDPNTPRFEPWPWALALALFAMISGSLTFYAIASANPDAEVVSDSYVAGLQYNEELALRRRAQEAGLRLDLRATPDAQGVQVFVRVADDGGQGRTASAMTVRRERPAEGGLDRDFELTRASGGGYAGVLPLPRPGRWRLVVTATVDGQPVRETFELRAERGAG